MRPAKFWCTPISLVIFNNLQEILTSKGDFSIDFLALFVCQVVTSVSFYSCSRISRWNYISEQCMARTPEVEEKQDAAARLDDLLADQGKTSGIGITPTTTAWTTVLWIRYAKFRESQTPPSAQPSICDAHIAQTYKNKFSRSSQSQEGGKQN